MKIRIESSLFGDMWCATFRGPDNDPINLWIDHKADRMLLQAFYKEFRDYVVENVMDPALKEFRDGYGLKRKKDVVIEYYEDQFISDVDYFLEHRKNIAEASNAHQLRMMAFSAGSFILTKLPYSYDKQAHMKQVERGNWLKQLVSVEVKIPEISRV